jgi:uncharacterized protein YdeI (YjbR/CyaY-like superfamily)
MSAYNKSIDAYIAKSAGFAQPILNHLRELIHTTCPDVEEKMKWSMPFFDYKGEMMCHMASFKQHCAFGFWKGAIMKDPVLRETAAAEEAMGHLGRITSLKDLPSDKKITSWIKEAMALNDNGIKLPPKPKAAATKETATPDYFVKAIAKNKTAKKFWDAFTPGKKKDYVVWITEAKTEDTRNKRMETAVEWIAEGKARHWKYEKK